MQAASQWINYYGYYGYHLKESNARPVSSHIIHCVSILCTSIGNHEAAQSAETGNKGS